MTDVEPICIDCGRRPEEIPEYIEAGNENGMTPDQYVREEEGTLNPANGHFLCTDDFLGRELRAGARLVGDNGGRWIAP